MSRKLFGTDGVRGRANTWPMTAELALKLGAAAGRHFRRDRANGHRVVIGKDTRLSCYMLETALTAGLASTGMNVLLLGPAPTPAVGLLTRSMRADMGIMTWPPPTRSAASSASTTGWAAMSNTPRPPCRAAPG